MLIKKPPLPIDHPKVQENLLFKQQFRPTASALFPPLRLDGFYGSCAFAILSGFGSVVSNNPKEVRDFYKDGAVLESATVYSVDRALEYWRHCKKQALYGPVLLTTINEHQYNAGLGYILTHYFDFKLLRPPFPNKGKDKPLIYLFELLD